MKNKISNLKLLGITLLVLVTFVSLLILFNTYEHSVVVKAMSIAGVMLIIGLILLHKAKVLESKFFTKKN